MACHGLIALLCEVEKKKLLFETIRACCCGTRYYYSLLFHVIIWKSKDMGYACQANLNVTFFPVDFWLEHEKIRAKGYRFPIERWTKMVIRPPSAAPTRETIGASKEYMDQCVTEEEEEEEDDDECYNCCCYLLLLLLPPLLTTTKRTSVAEEEELMDTGTSCRYQCSRNSINNKYTWRREGGEEWLVTLHHHNDNYVEVLMLWCALLLMKCYPGRGKWKRAGGQSIQCSSSGRNHDGRARI